MRRQGGQATVELVALVPLLVAVGAAILALLAAGRASSAAEAAAEAGAVALLQGGDPEAAARAVLGDQGLRLSALRVREGEVRVTVRPSLSLPAGLLSARASAHAGVPRPGMETFPLRGGDGAGAAP